MRSSRAGTCGGRGSRHQPRLPATRRTCPHRHGHADRAARDTLTVQLASTLSDEEARAKLESAGLTIVRELRFAPISSRWPSHPARISSTLPIRCRKRGRDLCGADIHRAHRPVLQAHGTRLRTAMAPQQRRRRRRRRRRGHRCGEGVGFHPREPGYEWPSSTTDSMWRTATLGRGSPTRPTTSRPPAIFNGLLPTFRIAITDHFAQEWWRHVPKQQPRRLRVSAGVGADQF